jgi:predicted transcriptional regulator
MHVLIQIDEKTARELERVAPARSRKRSAFIRTAIRKALMDEAERHTRERYLAVPDEPAGYFDPEAWEPARAARTGRPSRRKQKA